MEKERQSKVLAIVALVVAVAGLSLGFAAFSQTLSITSLADVTPNKGEVFVVEFEGDSTNTVAGVGSEGATAEAATIENGTTLSGIKAHFTAPGQTVTYTFKAANNGAIEAFLNKVTFTAAETAKCTAKAGDNGASATTMARACGNITVKVSVGGTEFSTTQDVSNTHSLAVGDDETVIVTITYGGTPAEQADGDFDVNLGSISLKYSAVAGALN